MKGVISNIHWLLLTLGTVPAIVTSLKEQKVLAMRTCCNLDQVSEAW